MTADQTLNDTTTDAETLDPESFDLDSWVTGGRSHRPTRTVTVYRDLHLGGELAAAQDRLDALNRAAKGDEELGGDPERSELEARVEDLATRMRATSAVVAVVGLIVSEEKAIEDAGHKPGTQSFTYQALAEAGTVAGRTLTAEQWEGLHSTIGHGQWTRILGAYTAAQQGVPDVTAPFSHRSSQAVTGD